MQKNLDAANRQPRRSDTSAPQGNDNEKLDISKLSDEDFDALPKSKLDELSGNNWRG